nr:NADH dehydrogenase subunit 4 [Chalcopteryx rutilans]
MLKFIFFVFFLIPLLFINYWVLVSFLFVGSVFYLLMGWSSFYLGNLGYFFGVDLLSYGLILLSFWICCLMLMASSGIYFYGNYVVGFILMNLFLLLFLLLTFSSSGLFMFYLFFESSLIPTFFLVLGWGYQPERVQAGIYLLFYTLFASLPLLISIFVLYSSFMTLNIYLFFSFYGQAFSFYFYFALVFAFLVKMPIFLFHLWLPKAHVEAPVAGSMILAGVLLKLGGYGLMRVFPIFCLVGSYSCLVVSVSLVGGFLVSLICLRQVDLKSLIAYSSVAHMGIVLAGAFTYTSWGLAGSYTLMLAHGLCSSGLFCLANISYERLGSRSMFVNKGLMSLMPSMSFFWFVLCAANMAAPPTLNLLGEISLLNSLVSWCWLTMILFSLLSFFSAGYTLYLYSYTQHGSGFSCGFGCISGWFREYLLLTLHWVPLNVLILEADFLFSWF